MDFWVPTVINELNLVANALSSRGLYFRRETSRRAAIAETATCNQNTTGRCGESAGRAWKKVALRR